MGVYQIRRLPNFVPGRLRVVRGYSSEIRCKAGEWGETSDPWEGRRGRKRTLLPGRRFAAGDDGLKGPFTFVCIRKAAVN